MKLIRLQQLQRLFVSLAVWMILTIPTPLWAAAEKDEKKMEWVLSYFCVLLFIVLGTLVLMRPTGRSDTVLTSEEQFAEKQERLKAAH